MTALTGCITVKIVFSDYVNMQRTSGVTHLIEAQSDSVTKINVGVHSSEKSDLPELTFLRGI